jgi:hypothetical protein
MIEILTSMHTDLIGCLARKKAPRSRDYVIRGAWVAEYGPVFLLQDARSGDLEVQLFEKIRVVP